MFAKVDMSEQRAKFLVMLGEIVRHLDLPENLIPALSALGRRHKDYGVRPIDYDRVREALFGAIAAELGDTFTDELREAWEEAYALISTVMQRASQTA
jgi:hemoglobin-like flavoprotein